MTLTRTCPINRSHGRMDDRYAHFREAQPDGMVRTDCNHIRKCPVCFHEVHTQFECTPEIAKYAGVPWDPQAANQVHTSIPLTKSARVVPGL